MPATVIDPHADEAGGTARIVVRPNRSLSWRGNVLFLASITAVSAIVAGGFAALGYWMMLPFAGLELAALGAGLYVCARKLGRCEVISIDEQAVQIESGYRYPQQRSRLQRAWVRVERRPSGWHRSRLLLRSHGREVEVGSCLGEEEKGRLERELRDLLRPQGDAA